eukprot:9135833-Pyramimonas_sp.AAC.1
MDALARRLELRRKGGSGQSELDAAKKKARDARATGFAERYNTPLDEHFDWEALGKLISGGLHDILSTLAFHVLIYLMSGLHPHEFPLATTPRQPGMLDRKA